MIINEVERRRYTVASIEDTVYEIQAYSMLEEHNALSLKVCKIANALTPMR